MPGVSSHPSYRRLQKSTMRGAQRHPVSECIPDGKCDVTAVKVLQLDRSQAERVRRPCFVKAVIVPGHLVTQASIDVDGDGSIGTLIVEVERPRGSERIQESGVTANETSSVTGHCGYAPCRFPHHRGVSKMIGAVVHGQGAKR